MKLAASFARACFVLVPAGLCLAWILAYASPAPEAVAWLQAWGETQPVFDWSAFFDFEAAPRLLVFRASYLSALAIPGVDFEWLPIASWLCALLCVLGLLRLIRHARGGEARGPSHWAALLLSAWCFAPVFGADWLIGTRIRVFLPALGFVACSLLLTGGKRFAPRYLCALVVACAAVFVDRFGSLVWIAAIPIVASEALRRDRRTIVWVATWCIVGNLASLACFGGTETLRDQRGLLGDLLYSPAAISETLLKAAGYGLPDLLPGKDTTELCGGLLLAALCLLLAGLCRRRSIDDWQRSACWLGFAVFGVGQALLIGHWFHPAAMATSLMRELAWSAFFLPVGVVGLVHSLWGRRVAAGLGIAAAAAFVLIAQAWLASWPKLDAERGILRQHEALLAIPPSEAHSLGITPSAQHAALPKLRSAGLLRGLPTLELEVDRAKIIKRPGFGEVTSITDDAAKGWVHLAKHEAQLLLLTRRVGARPERIFRVLNSTSPLGTERNGWSMPLEGGPFGRGEVVRALAFDVGTGRLIPLAGAFVREASSWRRATAAEAKR